MREVVGEREGEKNEGLGVQLVGDQRSNHLK